MFFSMTSKMSKSRGFCFTVNNYDENDEITLQDMDYEYLIYGREEAPTTKTKHLQGYIYFRSPRSFNAIKKKLPVGAHIEFAKGDAPANRVYCTKGGDWYEFGTMPVQGKRNDIIALRNAIRDGMTDEQIMENESLCETYGKYIHFVSRCRAVYDKKRFNTFRHLEVVVIYGPAGTGKTRYVYDHEGYDGVYALGQSQKEIWFDGYENHKVLLIDDFYGWIKWAFVLKILDGHPLRINIKGGTRWAGWDKVYITSNKPPWEWYSKGYPLELQRRINSIIFMDENGTEVRGNTKPAPPEFEIWNNN